MKRILIRHYDLNVDSIARIILYSYDKIKDRENIILHPGLVYPVIYPCAGRVLISLHTDSYYRGFVPTIG